jgi:hypothetical protein
LMVDGHIILSLETGPPVQAYSTNG